MKIAFRLAAISIFPLFFSALAIAAPDGADYVTPEKGSVIRKEILDAVRPKVEERYKQKLGFYVRALRTNGRYAVVFVIPLQKNGKGFKPDNAKNLSSWVFAVTEHRKNKWHVAELDLETIGERLEKWKKKYPAIPPTVFDAVGIMTNAEAP